MKNSFGRNLKMKQNIRIFVALLMGAWLLIGSSCGTLKKQTSDRQEEAAVSRRPPLSEEQQRRYDYFFLEAMRLKIQNEYAATFDLLQHCLSIDPNASSALYELAQYYLYMKQVPQGRAALERAVQNDPDNYWYSQALCALYMQQKETEQAATLWEKMAVRFPDKMEPLYALLDIYNQQEQYDKVIDILNRLEVKMGKNEQLSMEKFRVYVQKGDDKQAFTEIENLVAEYPNDLRYRVVLGDVYLQRGKKEEAYREGTLTYKAESFLSAAFEYEGKRVSLVKKEIEIARPDVVVFATGPSYAQTMAVALDYKPYQKKKIMNKSPKREVPVIDLESIKLDDKTVRVLWTYHPRYLTQAKYKDKNLFNEAIDKIKIFIEAESEDKS